MGVVVLDYTIHYLKQFCAWAGLVNCLFILMPTCIYILAQEADPKCLVDFSPGVSSVFSLAYPVQSQ